MFRFVQIQIGSDSVQICLLVLDEKSLNCFRTCQWLL